MYNPVKFQKDNFENLIEVMQKYPFATVITQDSSGPFVNHIPVIAEVKDGKLKLWGHMSRHNPQRLHLLSQQSVTIVFHGPHAYINPNWYTENDVPTWNYVTVHAKGQPRVIEDYSSLLEILVLTTKQMNSSHADQWKFYLAPDLRSPEQIQNGIVGFCIESPQLEGKFKLSQNRSVEDQKGVIQGLKSRKDDFSRAVSQWMARLLGD